MSKNFDRKTYLLQREKFYNSEIKIKYLLEKYTNFSKKSFNQIINTYNSIADTEFSFQKDVSLFNEEEMKLLFENNHWVFYTIMNEKRSVIREYMRWYRLNRLSRWVECDIKSTVDNIDLSSLSADHVYKLRYFLNYEDLSNCIETLFECYALEDYRILDLHVVAINLAWIGLTIEESVSILKSGISMNEDCIYLPENNQRFNVLPNQIELFRDFKKSDGYDTISLSGTYSFREYKPSEYLLRTARKSFVSKENLRTKLSNISEVYQESGEKKDFQYDKIRLSGIYDNLLKYESKYGILNAKDIKIFERYFRERFDSQTQSSTKLYAIIQDFDKYRDYYHRVMSKN